RLELARLELSCGRCAAALLQVERAIACRRDTGFADGLRLAAELSERLGRYGDAATYLSQLARVTSDDPTLSERAAALAARSTDPPPALPSDPPLPPALAALDDASLEVPARERVPGIIDRYFPEKGFGFLNYGEGQSIFFHVTQCEDTEGGSIAPGLEVTFRIGHNPKKGKPQAE